MKLTRPAHRSPLRGIAPLMLALALPVSAFASPPPEAAAQGFNVNTYSSNFTAKTVDMNGTRNRGYKWYIYDLYGRKASAADVKLNSDGSITLEGDNHHTGAEGTLASVASYPGTNAWVGTAFGGGGYFESVMKWNPADVTRAHSEGQGVWPGFWTLSMEGNFYGSQQWPGAPKGYQHNVEVDFFEADYYTTTNAYGVGLHDWYGIPNKTCYPGLCKVSMINPSGARVTPKGTNLNTYHTYGVLWVAATPTKEGSYSAFFDGKQIGAVTKWTQYTNQPPTPVGKTWAYGHMDQQHLFFILSTGRGVPFTLSSVNVWQKSAAENMKN